MLLAKKCQFFLYLNLIKIILEIMLSVFTEKNKHLRLKKTEKIAFLQRVNSMLLIKKCQFFSLFTIDQNIKD